MTSDPLDELEETLGYRFKDRSHLLQALTHSSRKADLFCSNERMEFLGDAILGAAVSEYLYRHYPEFAEGGLTRVKSAVVSRVSLAKVAMEMNLGRYLLVAKGVAVIPPDADTEAVEAMLPPSLLANALEAIIAAIYLDSGIRAAYRFVMSHLKEQMESICRQVPAHNFKSALQEMVQRQMGMTPVYKIANESGPDHGKWFEVITVINGRRYGTGQGRTKKEAEQLAAEASLQMLGDENDAPAEPPEGTDTTD